MSGRDRDPLLPRAVLVGIAIVVAVVWAITAVSVLFFTPSQPGALVTVSSLMALVLSAAFGIGGNLLKRPPSEESEPQKEEKSGSDAP